MDEGMKRLSFPEVEVNVELTLQEYANGLPTHGVRQLLDFIDSRYNTRR